MKRVLWLLLLGVLAIAGCQRQPATAALEAAPPLDIAPKQSAKVAGANVTDRVVNVRGPAIVFVIQNRRVRATFDLSHKGPGAFTVPLNAIDDGSGKDMHVGSMEDPMPKKLGDDMCTTLCANCIVPRDCCP